MRSTPDIRWNLLANLGGQAWRAIMSLLFVPFYLRILGIEAYGIIGIYASLQLALALLDAGLRPALAREMARFCGGGMDAATIRTLLRSVEVPLALLAGLIIFIMFTLAPFLSTHWVHSETIGAGVISRAFAIMGLIAAAQFVESAYDSCLSGLQRQVVQNAIITLVATLRGFGALILLWFWPTITAFFLWQAVVALFSLTMLGTAVYRSLPPAGVQVRFSASALNQVRNYAAGMLGIAVVSLLLTQSDKLLLAHFMPLSEMGRYALASALAGALSTLSTPVSGTFYPRMTELIERRATDKLALAFHQLSKLMVLLVGSAAMMLLLFGARLMTLWTANPALSAQTAPVLALLAIGGLFNALTALPYMLQLAHGRTGMTLRINVVMLFVFIPSLVLAVSHKGAIGAGICWALLNVICMTISAVVTFRRFLSNEARRWWIQDIFGLLAPIAGAGLLLRLLIPVAVNVVSEFALMALAGLTILACGVLSDAWLRGMAIISIGRIYRLSFDGSKA